MKCSAPLSSQEYERTPCFEAVESRRLKVPAETLIRGNPGRDPNPQAARLASQFIRQNKEILNVFDTGIDLSYDGNKLDLVFFPSTKIGALPLLSPTTGRPDYGLVIKPRFDWVGLGPMLATMGWRVLPKIVKLPMLPRSERKIPPWVLSTVILFRIQALLEHLDRRFEYTEDDKPAPRGTVNWARYAMNRIPNAQFLKVPCRYPDLRDDSEMKAAIHFTLLKQAASLESQRTGGIAVLCLIELCQQLLEKVRSVPPRQPLPLTLKKWLRIPLPTAPLLEGIQALEWTLDERGLAGLSDLEGLPWVLPMETFFEAWVETVVAQLSRKIGGVMRVGRKRETQVPLQWDPPYLGSQKYLMPDLMLERDEDTIIFDAKYKNHWEELNVERWMNLNEELRSRHREDLLQILAYANLSDKKTITVCLAYPCQEKTWLSLKERERLFHRARLVIGSRNVNLLLTAMPMVAKVDEICGPLAEMVHSGAVNYA